MGILRDTYIVNQVDNSPIYETNRILRERNKIIKENTEKEIKARDRVDITLEEYEQLKKENNELKTLLNSYQKFYNNLGIKIRLEPERLLNLKVVKVEEMRDIERFKNLLHIVFEIEPKELF